MTKIHFMLLKLVVMFWIMSYSHALINVTLNGSTERHVCIRENIYFKWTYDDTDPDKDFIRTIQWSKDPSGYLIMQYEKATNELSITSSPSDYTGRVERTTQAGSNDIGMLLNDVGKTSVDDNGKYYVSLIVDKPGGDANDYYVPYREQGVQVYVCVGIDDTFPQSSLSLTYDETMHVLTCSGPSSLGDTTFAIFDPSMNTVVDSTTDTTISKDITSNSPGGTYRCKTYCTRQGYDDTPQGTCLPADATLVMPGWSSWRDWTSCSTPGTLRTRTRDCTNPPPHFKGPQNCPGVSLETESCPSSPPASPGWSAWEDWTSCSTSGTFRTRTRDCNYPPQNCLGANSETEICPTPPSASPVNGGWGDWTSWTACSVTCDTGTQTRNRECDYPPPYFGGDDCAGPNDEIFECFERDCPAWSTWENWSECAPGASRTRTRDCNNPSPYVNVPQPCPGVNAETEICSTPPPTPPPPIDGSWGAWTNLTQCSVTCENGTQTRNRDCDNPIPHNGGYNCTGPYTKIFECFKGDCPETTEHQPEVDTVWPTFGPESGGTDITVRGQSLPRKSRLIVYLGPKDCTITYLNATVIIAHSLGLESDEAHLLEKKLPIYITIDNSTNLTSNAVFTYRKDPVVDIVYPKESIVSGGTFITAVGRNLYSVAVIKMETTMVLKKQTYQEPAENNVTRTVYVTDCEVQNETQMICETASIILPDVFIRQSKDTQVKREVNQLNFLIASDIDARHKRKKRQGNPQWVTHNEDYALEFYIGFRLDGVDDHTNFSLITIHSEPLFIDNGLKRRFTKDIRISFKGEHLDRGVTVYDYAITVGSGTCTDMELLSNTLSCLPPQTKPADTSISDPQIIIHIGLNVDHFVGHLIYPDEQMPLYVWILIGVLPALVIIIIIVTIVVCVKKRQNSTK